MPLNMPLTELRKFVLRVKLRNENIEPVRGWYDSYEAWHKNLVLLSEKPRMVGQIFYCVGQYNIGGENDGDIRTMYKFYYPPDGMVYLIPDYLMDHFDEDFSRGGNLYRRSLKKKMNNKKSRSMRKNKKSKTIRKRRQ
jgi:hypothetical protein